MLKKYKWVTIEEANEHWQKHYIGYETETGAIGRGDLWYLGNGTARTFNPYNPNWVDEPDEPNLFNLVKLKREYTDEEYQQDFMEHYDRTGDMNNLIGLFTEMYQVEGGHEMDNTWTGYNWYEISNNIADENWYIRGIAPAPYPCSAFGVEDSCAFVLEDYLTGDRWWLHTSREWITKMRNQMAPIYNNLYGLDKWDVEKEAFI
jgi:hypothetical protein